MEPKTVGRTQGAEAPKALVQHQGLCAGSIVLTLKGETPVEAIRVGDRVITRDSGTAVVRSVAQRTVVTQLIEVAAGSLGQNRPENDTVLPGGQSILIRDWRAEAMFGSKQALVPAAQLVDGEFIRDLGLREAVVYEIGFDDGHIVYADGLELDS